MNTVDDIEIYAKGQTVDDIQQWLTSTFETVFIINSGKVVHDLQVSHNGNVMAVMLVENAVGKAWTSIWFKSGQTPWENDTDCARSLNKFNHCQVRANAAPWSDGEDMDEWWQIQEDGTEEHISWPNAG